MKLKSRTLISVVSIILLASCATKQPADSSATNKTVEEKETNSTATKDTPTLIPEVIEEDEVMDVEEPTPEEIFIEDISNVFIKFTATPKITTVNRAFSGPYTVSVTDKNGVPLSDYILSVSYPSSKKDGTVSFTEIEVTTDENGLYSYTPEKPTFGCAEKITIYPTPLNESVKTEALARGASADWKVRSDIINKGAVLFVWDYNEKNRPVNNSYDILSEFRSRGMTMVGNAPVNETSYIGKSLNTLYKENYEIIEDSYGYLIVGTTKFTKPVEPCDDGYLCSLVSEIEAVSMKTGKKVFASTFTQEATGKNWNTCVTKCKEQLAEKIVDALVYGL